MKKISWGTTAFVIFFIAIVFPGLYLGGAFSKSLNYKESLHYYEKNSTYLSGVVEYMSSLPYEFAHCSSEYGEKIYCGVETGWINIDNNTARADLVHLFDSTCCKNIYKNGDTIEFHLWSKSMDVGGGIAYCESGELNIDFLTEAVKLSSSHWYFYVSDYNEWRAK